MKKTKTTIIFTTTLILALLSISIFIFFMKVIQNKNTHIQAVYTTLEEKTKEKNQIDTIRKNNDFIKQSQERVNSYFVDTTDISVLINYLESIGDQGGVVLTVDNVETSKTDDKFISVKVSLEGSFSSNIKTIRMLEHIPYKTHFNNIYINKDISEQNQSSINKKIVKPSYLWQTQISFDVLSSI